MRRNRADIAATPTMFFAEPLQDASVARHVVEKETRPIRARCVVRMFVTPDESVFGRSACTLESRCNFWSPGSDTHAIPVMVAGVTIVDSRLTAGSIHALANVLRKDASSCASHDEVMRAYPRGNNRSDAEHHAHRLLMSAVRCAIAANIDGVRARLWRPGGRLATKLKDRNEGAAHGEE